MPERTHVAAVVVAAGRSRRMGRAGDKVWTKIGGATLIERALRPFLNMPEISEVAVVVRVSRLAAARRLLARQPSRRNALRRASTKPVAVVAGGRERQDSVYAGLAAVCAPWVLVHDAARAAVRPALIRRVIRAARRVGAAIPVVPVTDTLKEVSGDIVRRTVDRSVLRAVQTPQMFRTNVLKRAIERARRSRLTGTDCAQLVERAGGRVAVVAGDVTNIKVTTPADLKRIAAWL